MNPGISLLSLCLVLLASCCAEDCPRYFQICAEIPEKKDIYKIGDTIKILSKFHHDVPAFSSEYDPIGTFNMQGIRWKPATAIFRVDTLGQVGKPRLAQSFTFLHNPSYDYQQFELSDDVSALDGEYKEANDSFYLEITLVTKRAGTFFLRQGSNVLAGDEPQKFPGKCLGVDFDVWTRMNEGGDNNIDFLKESPDPHWNTYVPSQPKVQFHDFGGYCFKVVP